MGSVYSRCYLLSVISIVRVIRRGVGLDVLLCLCPMTVCSGEDFNLGSFLAFITLEKHVEPSFYRSL